MEEEIVFKGTKDGLTLFIKENLPIEQLKEKILDKLNSAGNFFIGASIRLDIGTMKLEEDKIDEIKEMIQSVGLIFAGITVRTTSEKAREAEDDTDDLANSLLIKKTVRSGQRLNYNGNIIIMGDVNPGAEILASGDIIVMGRLKGMAHAGTEGCTDAVIMAFQLQPIQLRIGEFITRAPDNEGKSSAGPEIARVQDGAIIIEPYSS